jgi:hypothetical protein
MIEFCLGVVVGVTGLFAVAAHYSNKQKPKPEAKPHGVAATSMDMNNNGVVMLDAWHARLMRDVIERIEGKA